MSTFSMQPIGYVESPYKNAREVPRGLSTKHDADGILDVVTLWSLPTAPRCVGLQQGGAQGKNILRIDDVIELCQGRLD